MITRIIVAAIFSIIFAGVLVSEGYCNNNALEQKVLRNLELAEEAYGMAVDLDRSDPESARNYYIKAIMHYEWIIEEGGIRNGKLYYNIGNAYFRLGDIGRAILNYRRSELYIPNDQNLKQNLEYARSRRLDKTERGESEKVYKTLFFLHYDIPFRIRGMIFISIFTILWILAALYFFYHRNSIKISLIIVSIVCSVFLISLAVESYSNLRNPPGVVVADEVVARKGDAETYQPSFTEPLHSGTEFTLTESRSEWWHIKVENGTLCWIPADAGEMVKE